MNIYKNLTTAFLLGSLILPAPVLAIEDSAATADMSNIAVQQVEAPTIKVKKGSVLSLNDCIAIALNNSPEVRTAQHDYWITKTDINIAKSQFFPTINVGAGYDFTDTKIASRTSDINSTNLNATLNMLLFDFGKTYAQIKMHKFYLIADEYTFYNAVRTVTFDVKQKYYRVLAARANVLINQAYVDINERNYLRTKAYYDEGLKSKIDLVNSEVTLSDSKIKLIDSENAYENAIVNLNNSMYLIEAPNYSIEAVFGLNLTDNTAPVDLGKFEKISEKESSKTPAGVSDATLTSEIEKLELLTDYKIEKVPYSFDECLKMAQKNRADLKAYRSTVDAIDENLLFIKRNFYPAITANAGYGLRDNSASTTTNSLNVGVNISSSLNIMAQKNRVDAGKYHLDIAKITLKKLEDDIYFQVQNAYVNVIQLAKQIPLQAVKVRQTRENYELAEGRYYVGLSDYLELQNAKLNYNNAQHSYINAIYLYNVAVANLESVISYPQKITKTLEVKHNGCKKQNKGSN